MSEFLGHMYEVLGCMYEVLGHTYEVLGCISEVLHKVFIHRINFRAIHEINCMPTQ